MRKTRPITLPDHIAELAPKSIDSHDGTAESIDDSINASLSTICTDLTSLPHPSSGESESHQSLPLEDHHELSSITTLPASELEVSSEDHEPTVRESYQQTEPAYALTPTPSAPITEEDLIPYLVSASLYEREPPPLETNLDSPTQMNRPRQTGRRSEVRPRVVSITAERDASTNELIIRTNTVPAGSGAAGQSGSSPELRTSMPATTSSAFDSHQHQHQHHHHHRYGGMGSETSSIGSSRNPSPVSLLSTTTFSSIASGVDTER